MKYQRLIHWTKFYQEWFNHFDASELITSTRKQTVFVTENGLGRIHQAGPMWHHGEDKTGKWAGPLSQLG